MPDIIAVGSIFVDYFFEVNNQYLQAHHIKHSDDLLLRNTNLTLKDLTTNFPILYESPGGMPGNTIAVLSKMGVSTGYYGIVGKDKVGKVWLDFFKKKDLSRALH